MKASLNTETDRMAVTRQLGNDMVVLSLWTVVEDRRRGDDYGRHAETRRWEKVTTVHQRTYHFHDGRRVNTFDVPPLEVIEYVRNTLGSPAPDRGGRTGVTA